MSTETLSPQPPCGHTICAPGGRPCLFTGHTHAPATADDVIAGRARYADTPGGRADAAILAGRDPEAAAATTQGLDPIMADLNNAGIKWSLEQTGGYCMVVTVPGTLHDEAGTFTITAGSDYPAEWEQEPVWLVGFHPGRAWQDGPEGDDLPDEVTVSTETLLTTIQTGRFPE
jgi:hypothetical protein